jgi:Transposase
MASAAHVKNVPGSKTDVNDAMWLAELLAHALIRASFVPDTQTQDMRNLLRTHKQLVREQFEPCAAGAKDAGRRQPRCRHRPRAAP